MVTAVTDCDAAAANAEPAAGDDGATNDGATCSRDVRARDDATLDAVPITAIAVPPTTAATPTTAESVLRLEDLQPQAPAHLSLIQAPEQQHSAETQQHGHSLKPNVGPDQPAVAPATSEPTTVAAPATTELATDRNDNETTFDDKSITSNTNLDNLSGRAPMALMPEKRPGTGVPVPNPAPQTAPGVLASGPAHAGLCTQDTTYYYPTGEAHATPAPRQPSAAWRTGGEIQSTAEPMVKPVAEPVTERVVVEPTHDATAHPPPSPPPPVETVVPPTEGVAPSLEGVAPPPCSEGVEHGVPSTNDEDQEDGATRRERIANTIANINFPTDGQITSLDLCAGCGGIAHSLTELGLHATLIESEERCIRTLESNGYDNIIQAKLQDVDFTTFRDKIYVLTGGLPCQPPVSRGPSVASMEGSKTCATCGVRHHEHSRKCAQRRSCSRW